MTLVELMVVVSIIVLLMAVSVPLLKPSIDEGKIREASRQLNAYVAMVKSRAAQLGRPAGIWLQRSEPGSNACFELFMAEMPEPYSGDALGASIAFTFDNMNYNPGRWVALGQPGAAINNRSRGFFFSDTLTADPNNFSPLIGAGESFLIRFNYRGAVYQCTRDVNAPNRFFMPLGFVPPAGANGRGDDDVFGNSDDESGVPFQIFRSPERSMSRPLQLAGGVIIDLEFSGMGLDFPGRVPLHLSRIADRVDADIPPTLRLERGVEFKSLNRRDDSPVVIMYNPGGTVERVMVQSQSYAPTGTIHLLLGEFNGLAPDPADPVSDPATGENISPLVTERAESSPDAPNPLPWSAIDTRTVSYSANLANRSNIWVSLGHRTGSITTSPNAWELMPPQPLNGPSVPQYLVNSLRAAREFGQAGETMGGR